MRNAFRRISSESRYGFHVYLFDQTFFAIVKHAVEAISVDGSSTADTFVGIYVNEFFKLAVLKQLPIMDILCGEGIQLIFFACADSNVGGNTNLFAYFFDCRYGNYGLSHCFFLLSFLLTQSIPQRILKSRLISQ